MITLPIDPLLPEIVESVRHNANVILTATPGAGKTTRLPPELLNAVAGKVLVLEPRRMATVAACTRIAQERGWSVGAEAGYQVRFESRIGRDTRLIFMTDALLLRRMIDDPELDGVDLVVIDEFHERNLNQDLILGAIRELQELGRPIKLLVMSATLDVDRLARFLPGAKVVDVPGKVFPLEVRYGQQPLRLQTDGAFYDRVSEAVQMSARETNGDILVFLPGTGEIARTQERLLGRVARDIVILHGSLPLQEQQKVLQPPSRPRVILSTNVAEASVTVQGVDRVIDTGLAKVMDMNWRTGFSSLETTRISLFNARQRAGRAARQKDGVCVRLWTSHEEVTQVNEPTPECQRSDLSSALLWLAHLGVSDFATFSWFDRPPDTLFRWALQSLRALNALDRMNRLTPLGEKLIRYPLQPRYGGLLALGEQMGCGRLAARMAAILNDRDFADDANAHANTECDMLFRLEMLDDIERGQRPGGVHFRQAQAVLESARQLERLVQPGRGDADSVRRLLLLSQRDRLCRRRGGSERALMSGGRGVRLHPRSQVRQSEFFVALQGVDLPGQADTSIGLASGFDKDFLLQTLRDHIQVREDVYFDEEKGGFYGRRVRSIDDLAIDEPSLTPVDPAAVSEQMVDAMAERWDWLISKHEGLRTWMQRWRFLLQHESRFSEELGESQIRQVLEMAVYGRSKLAQILEQDIPSFFATVLSKDVLRTMENEVPARFTAPSGVSHPIQYDEMHSAFVEVRLQELFGLLNTPRIVFGKVPLTFRLLSPGFRPVQITSDLENFWRSGYLEVRKELRLRYPKHSWPEDPYSAKPEAKGRRR
ncbi:MAG: ATP-dependent helicase HrpB [Bdellovibrionales bacterium]|nr:ATP-dependent helicase HrpB [Bdellovibrionales bacterium]